MVKPGLIAIDGTRMAGDANSDATRSSVSSPVEILAEAQRDRRG